MINKSSYKIQHTLYFRNINYEILTHVTLKFASNRMLQFNIIGGQHLNESQICRETEYEQNSVGSEQYENMVTSLQVQKCE
jgi:hypothetical protein